MTGTETLAARGLLGLAGALATPLVARGKFFSGATQQVWLRNYRLLFALSRLLVFGLIFGLLHLAPRGDIPAYYYPQALNVLAGQRPYIDFSSSYAPLHSYLDAAAIFLWRSPLAVILLAVIAEIAAVSAWSGVAARFLPERLGRSALLLYLVSPLSVMFVVVDGQNNVIIGLFLALAVWFALQRRGALSGVSAALSACLVKFLSLIYFPVFVLTMRRRWSWAASAVATLLAVYGMFAARHFPILQPLTAEGDHRGASCLPFVVEIFAGRQLNGHLWDGLLVLTLLAILGLTAWVSRSSIARETAAATWNDVQLMVLLHGVTAMTLALLLLSKKSWPTYILMALFPLCVLVAQRRAFMAWVFGIFQLVAAVEHSYWASVLLQADSTKMRVLLAAGNREAFIQMGLEFLLLGGYALLLGLAIQGIRAAGIAEA